MKPQIPMSNDQSNPKSQVLMHWSLTGNWGLVIGILGILLIPHSVFATLGVSPGHLEFQMLRGQTQRQKIFIQNLGDTETQVAVTPERPLDVEPSELRLAPQAMGIVTVTAVAKSSRTEIAIAEHADGSQGLAVSSGIKIPVEVAVANPWRIYWLISAIIVAILFVVLYVRSRPKLPA